jgi:hypothetical protein
MPNPENVIGKGKLFSKTNQPANRGRKKSAYKELLGIIEQGGGTPLSYEEYKKMSSELLNLNEEALKRLANDKSTPIWFRAHIKGIVEDMKLGRTYTIEQIMDRLFGKATQPTDNKNEHIVRAKDLTPEEAREYLKQLNEIY